MRLGVVDVSLLEQASYRGPGCAMKEHEQTWSGEHRVLMMMMLGSAFYRGSRWVWLVCWKTKDETFHTFSFNEGVLVEFKS